MELQKQEMKLQKQKQEIQRNFERREYGSKLNIIEAKISIETKKIIKNSITSTGVNQ